MRTIYIYIYIYLLWTLKEHGICIQWAKIVAKAYAPLIIKLTFEIFEIEWFVFKKLIENYF